MLKYFINISLVFVLNIANAQPAFSPYADLTINTKWDSETNSMQPMPLEDIAKQTGIKGYHLAFIVDKSHCVPAWAGQYETKDKWATTLTARLHEQGISTTISFGGAAGNDLSLHCSKQQLVSIFTQVATDYHADGLDFDIENGTANVNNLMDALKVFHKTNPKIKLSFTLPTLPEGLTQQGVDIVRSARDHELAFSVNIMAMDYGPAYSQDMGEYAIEAANSLFNTLQTLYPKANEKSLWSRIIVTPMIGVNDVNTEKFTLENADRLSQWAREKGVGLSMWSIARDNPCSSIWASPICSGANLQNKAFEYSEHLN